MIPDSELDALLAAFRAKNAFMLDGDHAVRQPPMTMQRLTEIENETGVELPHQYKRHLCQHGSGDFAFSSIYSPDPELNWSLWNDYEYMPANRGRFLPIADNGGGDYYGFRIVDGRCTDPICWADHESDYAITDPDYADFNTFIAEVALRA
ncbi:MAG: SMI1/KNR4 family protein [Planctomycetota bacterium]